MKDSENNAVAKAVEEVVNPIKTLRRTKVHDPAPSIQDLNGKTICELWNYAFQGDRTFPFLEEALKRRYPDMKFVPYTTFGNIHGSNDEARTLEELPARLREFGCDAVITGNGG